MHLSQLGYLLILLFILLSECKGIKYEDDGRTSYCWLSKSGNLEGIPNNSTKFLGSNAKCPISLQIDFVTEKLDKYDLFQDIPLTITIVTDDSYNLEDVKLQSCESQIQCTPFTGETNTSSYALDTRKDNGKLLYLSKGLKFDESGDYIIYAYATLTSLDLKTLHEVAAFISVRVQNVNSDVNSEVTDADTQRQAWSSSFVSSDTFYFLLTIILLIPIAIVWLLYVRRAARDDLAKQRTYELFSQMPTMLEHEDYRDDAIIRTRVGWSLDAYLNLIPSQIVGEDQNNLTVLDKVLDNEQDEFLSVDSNQKLSVIFTNIEDPTLIDVAILEVDKLSNGSYENMELERPSSNRNSTANSHEDIGNQDHIQISTSVHDNGNERFITYSESSDSTDERISNIVYGEDSDSDTSSDRSHLSSHSVDPNSTILASDRLVNTTFFGAMSPTTLDAYNTAMMEIDGTSTTDPQEEWNNSVDSEIMQRSTVSSTDNSLDDRSQAQENSFTESCTRSSYDHDEELSEFYRITIDNVVQQIENEPLEELQDSNDINANSEIQVATGIPLRRSLSIQIEELGVEDSTIEFTTNIDSNTIRRSNSDDSIEFDV